MSELVYPCDEYGAMTLVPSLRIIDVGINSPQIYNGEAISDTTEKYGAYCPKCLKKGVIVKTK